jgi:hypothetical protein
MSTTPTQTNPAKVRLRDVRLSFSSLFTQSASVKDGPLKYRANLIIDPNTVEGKNNLKLLLKARKDVEIEKFGREMEYKDPKRLCIKKGDDQISEKTGEPYDGYAGMIIVSATNGKKFPIVDCDLTPLSAEDGKPYNGCYVNVQITLYAIKDKDKGGNGIFASLDAVQFKKHGTPFGGGGVKAEDVFEVEELDEDDV